MRHEYNDCHDDEWDRVTGLGIPRNDGIGDAESGEVFRAVEDDQNRIGAGLIDIQKISEDDSVCCHETEKI